MASSTQQSWLDFYCRMGPCSEPCPGLASDRQGPSQQDSFWLSPHSNHPKWAGVKPEESGGKEVGKKEGLSEEKLGTGGPCAQTHCGTVYAAELGETEAQDHMWWLPDPLLCAGKCRSCQTVFVLRLPSAGGVGRINRERCFHSG